MTEILYTKDYQKIKRKRMCGSNNPNWKGGIFDYPNHSFMKKQRKIKLKQTENKCEKCNKEKKKLYIHHIDRNKENHSLNNLLIVCAKCHGVLHKGRKNKKTKTSKFIKMYGYTLYEISEKLNLKPSKCYILHQLNLLKKNLTHIM